jgi:hypothetical protein
MFRSKDSETNKTHISYQTQFPKKSESSRDNWTTETIRVGFRNCKKKNN